MKPGHVLIGAILLAVGLLGGLWLLLRHVPPSSPMSGFQQICLEGQRRGISGDVRPLHDESEARLLHYCDRVAREVASRLSQRDIAATGLEEGGRGPPSQAGRHLQAVPRAAIPRVPLDQVVGVGADAVALMPADALETSRGSGATIETAALISGGSRSVFWTRLRTSALGLPTIQYDGATLGPAFDAARLAWLATTGEAFHTEWSAPRQRSP